jgi:ABC-type nitrate/sulfonate/bicarbonate transport system ATPase subunit
MGAGKSTLLNVLAHLLDSNIVSEVFKTSSELISCTEGIWIYPYPLISKNNPEI